MSDEPIERARIEAAEAKARMIDAAHALQARLKPATLANGAWEEIRDRGEVAVTKAARLAKARPAAAAAVAFGIVGFFLRRPVARLIGKITRRAPKPPKVITSKRSGAKS